MARGRRRGNFVQGDDRLCLGKGPGIVYLMHRSDGLHKIGHTSNLKKRFTLAKYENRDYTLEIVHTVYVDNRIEAERWWHRRFASKRVWNEWFNLSADDVGLFLSWRESS